jgi:predicted dehydrogenase
LNEFAKPHNPLESRAGGFYKPRMTKLRWGILGAANIARKNWKAFFHAGNSVVAAVAARDISRATAFVQECQAQHAFAPTPRALGSYEELLAASDVDAVYIPLPTAIRKEWVLRAAQAGKHVLCEKPCAVNASDLREMIAACAKHKVQFMDGVMFMHHPRLTAIRAALDDARRIGPLRRIASEFSFFGDAANFGDNIRVQGNLEPAGCLGDLGWYCLRISLFAKNWELPTQVSGRILAHAADGVTPTQFSGELVFADGSSAGFHCSFLITTQQWVHFMGQRGTVAMADFVHPHNSYEAAYEINQIEHRVPAAAGVAVPVDAGALTQSGHATAQDTLMIRNFAAQVGSGRLNQVWPEIALKTQLVQDACLASARADGRLVAVQKV